MNPPEAISAAAADVVVFVDCESGCFKITSKQMFGFWFLKHLALKPQLIAHRDILN
jgi:hypothetical protein